MFEARPSPRNPILLGHPPVSWPSLAATWPAGLYPQLVTISQNQDPHVWSITWRDYNHLATTGSPRPFYSSKIIDLLFAFLTIDFFSLFKQVSFVLTQLLSSVASLKDRVWHSSWAPDVKFAYVWLEEVEGTPSLSWCRVDTFNSVFRDKWHYKEKAVITLTKFKFYYQMSQCIPYVNQ
jgi:hypothetical protein